jgi:hypothetical protein
VAFGLRRRRGGPRPTPPPLRPHRSTASVLHIHSRFTFGGGPSGLPLGYYALFWCDSPRSPSDGSNHPSDVTRYDGLDIGIYAPVGGVRSGEDFGGAPSDPFGRFTAPPFRNSCAPLPGARSPAPPNTGPFPMSTHREPKHRRSLGTAPGWQLPSLPCSASYGGTPLNIWWRFRDLSRWSGLFPSRLRTFAPIV